MKVLSVLFCCFLLGCSTIVSSSLARLNVTVEGITEEGDKEIKRYVGTAFFVNDSGLLITAAHTLEGANMWSITMADGQHSTSKASIVAIDYIEDIALIQVPYVITPTMRFCSTRNMRPGDDVLLLAYRRYTYERSVGIYAGMVSTIQVGVLEGSILPGYSGGAVYSEQNKCVLGIIKASNMDAHNPLGTFVRPESSDIIINKLCELAPASHPAC